MSIVRVHKDVTLLGERCIRLFPGYVKMLHY